MNQAARAVPYPKTTTSFVSLKRPDTVWQDGMAKSVGYFATQPMVRFTAETAAELRKAAAASGRNARLCLHRNPLSALHEMAICTHHDLWFRPKKHSDKAKSFHIIDGEMAVFVFDDDGAVVDAAVLGGESGGIIYRVGAGLYHCDIPMTPLALHCEVTTGPFLGGADRLLASWGPADNDTTGREAFRSRLMAMVDADA